MKHRAKAIAMIIVAVILCTVFLTACGMPILATDVYRDTSNVEIVAQTPENNDETTGGDTTDKPEHIYDDGNNVVYEKPNAPENKPNGPISNGNETAENNVMKEPISSVEATGNETPIEDPSDAKTVTVIYLASEGGRIDGESVQVLDKDSKYSTKVVAEANVGYKFVKWTDGDRNKQRHDPSEKSFTVTAEFEAINSGITEKDLLFNLLHDGTGYSVEAYNRRLTVADIPSFINGLPVKEVASRGFDYCMELKSVCLPETVKVIREYAFEECPDLKKIKGMSGVEEICEGAFAGCEQLERVVGICNVKKIRVHAFSECFKLENLILSDTVEYLESGNKTIECLSNPVFLRKTKEEFKALSVNKFNVAGSSRPKVIYIGTEGKPTVEYSNKDDDELFNFTLTSDGKGFVVSAKDVKMTEALIPSYYNGIPITEIAERGFADCGVVTVYIPDTVKKIGDRAFAECGNLNRVAGLNGVTIIGNEAFAYCRKLGDIVLPNTLEVAGSYIFKNNSKTIYIRKTKDDVNKLNYDWDKGRPDSAKTVCVGETGMPEDIGYGMHFAKSKPHKELFPDIEEFMLLLWADPNLTGAIIPPYVDGLPVKCILAFYDCEKLKWVFIPDTVEIILGLSFCGCENLECIYGAQNVRLIEICNGTFKDCDTLRQLILSNWVIFSKDYITSL